MKLLTSMTIYLIGLIIIAKYQTLTTAIFVAIGLAITTLLSEANILQLFEKKVIEREQGIPYLIRWNILGLGKDSRFFSIKLHKILISDSECLHDHPWPYISIILKGGYTETSMADYGQAGTQKWIYSEESGEHIAKKWYGPGSILFRPAQWAHQLEVTKPCWTLVFTFKKVRTWGFFTKKGWKHWTTFNQQKDC